VSNTRINLEGEESEGFLDSVIERWRGATMSHRGVRIDDGMGDLEPAKPEPPIPTVNFDPERTKLLRKAAEGSLNGANGANGANGTNGTNGSHGAGGPAREGQFVRGPIR
jgi:hypothetical protein